MIGVMPPSNDATLHVIEGGLSPSYLTQFARAHDEAGFDLALVGHTSSSAEGFLVALYAAGHTDRLGYLVAHRPGFVAPTLAARKLATLDHFSGGRLGVHIISANASDLIAEAVVAMEFKAASEDIGRICHPHPSLSEVMREAALAVDKRALNM